MTTETDGTQILDALATMGPHAKPAARAARRPESDERRLRELTLRLVAVTLTALGSAAVAGAASACSMSGLAPDPSGFSAVARIAFVCGCALTGPVYFAGPMAALAGVVFAVSCVPKLRATGVFALFLVAAPLAAAAYGFEHPSHALAQLHYDLRNLH